MMLKGTQSLFMSKYRKPLEEYTQFVEPIKLIASDGGSCGFFIIVTHSSRVYQSMDLLSESDKFTELDTSALQQQAIKHLACTNEGTMLVTESNEVWANGTNRSGELGLGHSNPVKSFTRVPLKVSGNVTEISMGHGNSGGTSHTLIVYDDRVLYAAGSNENGRLGLPKSTQAVNTFQKVDLSGLKGRKIKQMECGGYYSILLTEDDQLWGCGYNNRSQLHPLTAYHVYGFTLLSQFTDVKRVACAYSTTIVLHQNGVANFYNSYVACKKRVGVIDLVKQTPLVHTVTGFIQCTMTDQLFKIPTHKPVTHVAGTCMYLCLIAGLPERMGYPLNRNAFCDIEFLIA